MDVDMPSQTSSSSSSSCSLECSYYSYPSYTNDSNRSYSSSMSTPQKKGPINIPILQHTRTNVDGSMKQEMEGHIQEVELEKLVKVLFGLTDEEVAVIKSATWTLPQKPLKNYKLKVRPGSHECHRYPYIQAILQGVVTQLEHPKPGFNLRGGNHSGATFYVEMDGNRRLKAQGVSRGPDGWMGWTRPSTLTWNSIKAVLEIKVTRGESVRQGMPRERKSLAAWESSLDPNRSKKDAIFGNQDSLQLIIDCVQDQFQPLINEWIHPLCDMFAAGISARNDYARYLRTLDPNIKPVPFDNFDMGGHITFEAFMKSIGREPRVFKSK